VSYSDIKTMMRLFIGERQTLVNQEFEILAEIAGKIWGGKTEDDLDREKYTPKNKEEAMAMFKAVMNPTAQV